MDYGPPASSVRADSLGKNTGMGCHTLLQGTFPAQGLNSGLGHCRQILYCLSHQGSLMLSHKSRKQSSLLFHSFFFLLLCWFESHCVCFILFSFYYSVGLGLPVFEFINPFYCHLVCCWTPRVYFSDKLLYPSTLWLLFGTFLYFLFVEVHSFFSQVTIIMTMILNSLTGESFISFSVRTFSEVLSCSFTWT